MGQMGLSQADYIAALQSHHAVPVCRLVENPIMSGGLIAMMAMGNQGNLPQAYPMQQ
jgi:hypothetical protein